MTIHMEAVYDDGVLRLSGPVPLRPQQQVHMRIEVGDDPSMPHLLHTFSDSFDLAPSIDEVHAATAAIAGNMSEAVIAARQSERF